MISYLSVATMLVLSACSGWQAPTDVGWNTNTPQASSSSQDIKEPQADGTYLVEMTSDWFSPDTLTIKVWDKVNFVNNDSSPHWPASARHPTHTVYPWSWIEKCWTSEQSGIFDACKWLAQGETFSFVFTHKWEWKYHDHLNPSTTWTIIVQ